MFFETHKQGDGKLHPNGRLDSTNFPLTQTEFTDWYLHGDGSLSTTPPAAPESDRFYLHGTRRQFWSYQAGGERRSADHDDGGTGRADVADRAHGRGHRHGRADRSDVVGEDDLR